MEAKTKSIDLLKMCETKLKESKGYNKYFSFDAGIYETNDQEVNKKIIYDPYFQGENDGKSYILFNGKRIGIVEEWQPVNMFYPICSSFILFPKSDEYNKYCNDIHFIENEYDELHFSCISELLQYYFKNPGHYLTDFE